MTNLEQQVREALKPALDVLMHLAIDDAVTLPTVQAQRDHILAAVARALEATIRNAGRFTQDELQELRDLFLAKLREVPDA